MNLVGKPDFVRQEYKKYKRKKPPPDFSDVIDISSPGIKTNERVIRSPLEPSKDLSDDGCKVGLINPVDWEVFLLERCPGFMIIRNPFLPAAQKYWSYKALTDYTKTPYPCNLDNIHVEKGERENWENVWQATNKKVSSPSSHMEQLRWTHLGYHFDYNFVNYKEEKYFGFPDDLASLMKFIAGAIGYDRYVPETGIVNYYPIGSSMGGHTDHYEEELDAPLLSISFGQPAVFLIGGSTKDVKPEAVWIRSGDIVIMSGESRVAYHAVPCIVKEGAEGEPPNALKSDLDYSFKTIANEEQSGIADVSFELHDKKVKFLSNNCYCGSGNHQEHLWSQWSMSSTEWEPFSSYLSKTRININVRQVHKV